MRTCVGCQGHDEAKEMIRFVDADSGDLAVDLGGRAFGRGAWAHARPECLMRAAAGGLARSFRRRVTLTPDELVERLRAAADRRVAALLGSARASGKLKIGSDACREIAAAGQAELLVVAADARAAAQSLDGRAVGRTLVWGDKAGIGMAVGRSEAGVVGVTDPNLSAAIARAVGLSKIQVSPPRPRAARSHVSVEVE